MFLVIRPSAFTIFLTKRRAVNRDSNALGRSLGGQPAYRNQSPQKQQPAIPFFRKVLNRFRSRSHTSLQDRETMPPPGSPPHTGEKRNSLPTRHRSQVLPSSFPIDSVTMMMTRKRNFGSSAGASTADGSARARQSGMVTRSNSAPPSFRPATLESPPPQAGMRADGSSREPQARSRRAVTTDLSHYQLTSRTYQTPKYDKKPQPLISTVRELLPDNFRYGFGCHLISYNCHDCPQIQDFGYREGACRHSSVASTSN
jgi:hypothetical protein